MVKSLIGKKYFLQNQSEMSQTAANTDTTDNDSFDDDFNFASENDQHMLRAPPPAPQSTSIEVSE